MPPLAGDAVSASLLGAPPPPPQCGKPLFNQGRGARCNPSQQSFPLSLGPSRGMARGSTPLPSPSCPCHRHPALRPLTASLRPSKPLPLRPPPPPPPSPRGTSRVYQCHLSAWDKLLPPPWIFLQDRSSRSSPDHPGFWTDRRLPTPALSTQEPNRQVLTS